MLRRSFLISVGILTPLLSGCAGYHIGPVKPTPMKEVQALCIPNFRNDTLEPRIEALIANALIKQVHQDGTYRVSAEADADAIVEGTILRLERSPTRGSKSDFYQTSEYGLGVVARVRVVRKSTRAKLLEKEFTGRATFLVSGNDLRTADVNTDEKQAIPLAAADLASQLVSFLSEGW